MERLRAVLSFENVIILNEKEPEKFEKRKKER